MTESLLIEKTPRLTIFYDGSCPLCRREVQHYQQFPEADELCWLDVSRQDISFSIDATFREKAMARFHVRDAAGQWFYGAYAFAELWSCLPYYKWLASFVRGSRILPALDFLYTRFARWRLLRNGQCTSTECNNRTSE